VKPALLFLLDSKWIAIIMTRITLPTTDSSRQRRLQIDDGNGCESGPPREKNGDSISWMIQQFDRAEYRRKAAWKSQNRYYR
jgi:hypothetical protein